MNGFNKRYFLLIALAFLIFLGISLACDQTIFWIIFALSLILVFVLTKLLKVKRKNLNTVLMLILIASIVGVGRAEMVCFKNNTLAERYTGNHIICGYVKEVSSSYPYMSESIIKIDSVDGKKANFDAVLFSDFALELDVGDRFECVSDISLLSEYKDGDFLYNKDNCDLPLICLIKSEEDFIVEGSESNIYLSLRSINSKLSARLKAIMGSKNGSLASALLLGNRELLDDATLRDFKRAGVYHMLALSGLHVAILVGILDYILKKLRVNSYIRILLLTVSSVFYVALTGFQLSACRALLMLLIVYVSMIVRSRGDAMTSLFAALSAICFISPYAILDIGLQLSFLSTFGAIIAGIINNKLDFLNNKIIGSEFKKKAIKVIRSLLKIMISSVCVFVATLPFIMKCFGEVSMATFISNIFMGAICEAFMIFSLLALLFFNLNIFGGLFSHIAIIIGNFMIWIVNSISYVDGVMLSLTYPNLEYIVLGLFVLSILLFAVKLKRRWLIAAPSIAFILLLCVNVYTYKISRNDFVRAEYLLDDVLVLSSADGVYICDASDGRYGGVYEGAMLSKENGFTEIDGVVLTHYHSYHATSLSRLANTFIVDSVYVPKPQNEREAMVMSAIFTALEDTKTKVYMYDMSLPLEILGGELVVSDRVYSSAYTHPSTALTYSYKESRITLIENPYFDTYLEESESFKDYLSESDIVIFGSDGRAIEKRFEVFCNLKQGADVVFANRETMLLSDCVAYIDNFRIYTDVGYKKYDLK